MAALSLRCEDDTMDVRHLFCIVTLFGIYLPKGEQIPQVLDTCSKNCTLAPHLQCWITTNENDCDPIEKLVDLWPGAPQNFNWTLKYRIINNRCVGSPEFHWLIPADSSALTVKGFRLVVVVMEGLYANYRVCVTFNLTKAFWSSEDIIQRIKYSYDCILLSPGTYFASLYSLPMPAIDQLAYLYLHIPDADIEKEQRCVPLTNVAPPKSAPASLTPVQPRYTHQQTSNTESQGNRLKWASCIIGVASGLALIILIVVLTRKCSSRHPQQHREDNSHCLVDDQDDFPDRDCNMVPFPDHDSVRQSWPYNDRGVISPIAPSGIESNFSAFPDHDSVRQSWPYNNRDVIPPIAPSDIESNFSAEISRFND